MASRYEIQLSETARADFDRLQSEAASSPDALRQLLEVHALLDLLAEGDLAKEVVLPGNSTEPALRYRSEGGVYIYFRRIETSRSVIVAFFCELPPEQAVLPSSSAAPQLVDFKLRDVLHGMEAESAVEFTGEDGSRRRMRSFVRKVDWGDSYTVFNHFAMDAQPARTMITTGQKGQIEGDWRKDTIEVVELRADGTVRSFPPQTVPVWLRNPFYEGTSTKDVFARMQNDPIWKARLAQIRSLLDQNPGDQKA
jgi:hypothetical protein